MRLCKRLGIFVFILAAALIPLTGCGSGSSANTTGTGGFGMKASGQAAMLAGVYLSQSSVSGGSTTQLTIALAQPAPANGLTVALASSDPGVVPIPQSVTVAAGQTSARVVVPTVAISETTSVSLSARYKGSDVGVSLNVASSNATALFTVTTKPATVTVQQGKTGTSIITTKGSSGFDQALQLSVSKEPSGVSASLSPKTIAAPGSGSSKLTLNVPSSLETGSYPLSVKASDGKTSESAALTLKVVSGSSNPDATFQGCWYKTGGNRYQAVDVSVKNSGTYPFNAVLYYGATCNPNDWADQFGFGQPLNLGGFTYTFWFSDFKDQTNMSALWYVGDQSSQCVNYAVAPDC
jgi:hypothetical protein